MGWGGDILGLLAQKPPTARIMGGDPKLKASFSCQLKRPTAIYADGARAWSKAARVLKVPCFQVNHQHKEYASTIRKVPKGLSKISGTQTIDSDWKSLKCWLPKEASKKRGTVDLVTHSSKLEQRVWQWMWRRTKLRGNNSETCSHEQIVQWLK